MAGAGNIVRKRVVILGGGFAGINAAMGLGRLPLDVTLVDRKNHHTFQPLLYQVALAVLSPAEIAQPIRSIVRDYPNTEVLMDEAVGFDVEQRRVQLKSGAELTYDYLVMATGSTHSYFGRDEWARLAPGLTGIYQVQAKVPNGVSAGSAVPIVVSAAGQLSQPVTIAIH